MANYTTGSQRHNNRQDKIWETYKRLEAQRKSVLSLRKGDTFALVSDIKWTIQDDPIEKGGFVYVYAIDELQVKRNFKFAVESFIVTKPIS